MTPARTVRSGAGERAVVPGTRRTFDTDEVFELADATEYRQHKRSGLHHTPDCFHGAQAYDVIPRDDAIARWFDTPRVPADQRHGMAWCESCAAVRVTEPEVSAAEEDYDLLAETERVRPLAEFYRRAIADADSVFTPGTPVWTAPHVSELVTAFVDRPDEGGRSFGEKLTDQLDGASDGALQLFAELWCLSLAPLADYTTATKRRLLGEALERMQDPVSIPDEVDEALGAKAFAGGVAFKTRRPFQLALLVKVADALLTLDTEERSDALTDPAAFDDVLASVHAPQEPAQRHALRWILFPDHHLPIVSEAHRDAIRKAFTDLVEDDTASRDDQLLQIRDALVAEDPERTVNFYLPPLVERWKSHHVQQRAWLVRGSSVGGHDLIPEWLRSGYVSLPAAHLPMLEPETSRDELKAIVEDAYGHTSYAARAAKRDEFDLFWNKMQEGDLVVTVSQGRIYVGRIAGGAEQPASDEAPSALHRSVTWDGPEQGFSVEQLPKELASRMQAQHDVLDLTQQLSALEALLDADEPVEPAPTAEELELPDATEELAETLHVGQSWIQEVVELLRDRPQLIFYGPPGTGKTYLAQKIGKHLAGGDSSKVKLVQFHPAYSYEDFFEGYRPTREGGFDLTPGPMRRIVDQARENPTTPYVLIIDEINRGNLAKVFGELYFLLEYREEVVDLMYAPDDAGFTLPSNVYIIGTMNTADRSIALVDSAMRRRFSFMALHPSEEPTAGLLRRWLQASGRPAENADLLDELNRRIEDPDFKIGPSYFMRPAVYKDGGLERTWRTSVLPLLEEHHFGDGVDVDKTYGLETVRAAVRGAEEGRPAAPSEADGGDGDGDAAAD